MIKLIAVGSIKESYLKDAIKDYFKRISKYTKLEIIEINDNNFDEVKTKKIEGENILKKINPKDYVIALAINGTFLDTNDFAEKMDNLMITNANIVFVIGGSYGLDEEVLKRADYLLSFSKLTFPHQLFRVMFLEQLYRTFKIRNGESYHK
jgi:23S rRNA (pseudouridine1915-N3)-methyltransferase